MPAVPYTISTTCLDRRYRCVHQLPIRPIGAGFQHGVHVPLGMAARSPFRPRRRRASRSSSRRVQFFINGNPVGIELQLLSGNRAGSTTRTVLVMGIDPNFPVADQDLSVGAPGTQAGCKLQELQKQVGKQGADHPGCLRTGRLRRASQLTRGSAPGGNHRIFLGPRRAMHAEAFEHLRGQRAVCLRAPISHNLGAQRQQ